MLNTPAVTFLGSQHERIPPGAHTGQGNVETLHRFTEDAFIDLKSPAICACFLRASSIIV